jgi:hypothetical protein
MMDEKKPPSQVAAFTLVVIAVTALLVPVAYTIKVQERFGPFGTLIAWTTVSVGIFAVLTVVVSFLRHFVRPALEQRGARRP